MSGKFRTFRTDGGLVLVIKPVPILLVQEVMRRLKPPPVPVVFMEEKGRAEENPNDPTYRAALESHESDVAAETMDAFMRLGVFKVESVPSGYESVDGEDWFENVLALLPDTKKEVSKKQRTLLWLKFYILDDGEEIKDLVAAISGLSGVRNEDVNAAMQTFPGDEE